MLVRKALSAGRLQHLRPREFAFGRRHAARSEPSRRSAKTSATLRLLNRTAASSSAAARCIFTDRISAEVRSIVVKPEAKGQGAGGRILGALDRRGGRTRHPVRVPVHAHSGLLLQVWIPDGRRQGRTARQDFQGLPDVSETAPLRRSRDGARADSAHLDSRATGRSAAACAPVGVVILPKASLPAAGLRIVRRRSE